MYAEYYQLIDYNPPWIGYFAMSNAGEPVGAGGYKGMPKEGKVELAYTTFKGYEARE